MSGPGAGCTGKAGRTFWNTGLAFVPSAAGRHDFPVSLRMKPVPATTPPCFYAALGQPTASGSTPRHPHVECQSPRKLTPELHFQTSFPNWPRVELQCRYSDQLSRGSECAGKGAGPLHPPFPTPGPTPAIASMSFTEGRLLLTRNVIISNSSSGCLGGSGLST